MVVPQFDKFDEETPEVKKEYWDNGKLKREVHLKNGKPEGLETWWYESGEKNLQTHYKNGKENGVRKV
jgi:antitoxin component YwqK of YwqJK toxin-antitoxin module